MNEQLIQAGSDLSDEITKLTEKLRVRKLVSYNILDTGPEQPFDDIVKLASYVCETPIAAITFIDDTRQFIKAAVVPPAGPRFDFNSPREDSFCNVSIKNPKGRMVVRNAEKSDIFKNYKIVTGPEGIKFYAGVPLVAPTGEPLGALCVIDQRPRNLNEVQLEQLDALARLVMNLLNNRTLSMS